jgi:hypothetical protein
MRSSWIRAVLISSIILAALVGSVLVMATRNNRLMLYQHGTPEVPGGHAFAIMNPFRNRRPEKVAEELMSDLRTNRCGQILRNLHFDDSRICPVIKEDMNARLIWREDGPSTRVLVYDLSRSKSRLWITSRRDEVGFVVSGVSLIR